LEQLLDRHLDGVQKPDRRLGCVVLYQIPAIRRPLNPVGVVEKRHGTRRRLSIA
jgi:hypothetical protein